MYAKKVRTPLPAENIPLGYDFQLGDWVQPYGNGHISDFIFTYSRELGEDRVFSSVLDISFANEGDGIQHYEADPMYGSKLRLPNLAPETGYLPRQEHGFRDDGSRYYRGPKKTDNYSFRIRAKLDEEGRIIRSHYGKLYGPIKISGAKRDQVEISFTYYLNPISNDRNVEFDPEQNLFRNLTSSEEVREP